MYRHNGKRDASLCLRLNEVNTVYMLVNMAMQALQVLAHPKYTGL